MILKGRKNRERHHPLVLWSRIKIYWPLIVWLAAIALVAILFNRSRGIGNLSGIVWSDYDRIAPLETARVTSVEAKPGDAVAAGQILVVMDATSLEAELRIEKLSMRQRIDSDAWRLQSEIRELLLAAAQARAELTVIDTEMERQQELLERGLLDAGTVAELDARRRSLEAAIGMYPQLISQAESQLEYALQNQREMDLQWEGGGEDGLIARRVREYILRARRAGRVAEILCQPGDVVPAGDSAVLLISNAPTEILALIPEALIRDAEIGMTATITKPLRPRFSAKATLTAVGPQIRTWPMSTNSPIQRTTRGEWALFAVAGEEDLIPGESVKVDIRPPSDLTWPERLRNFLETLKGLTEKDESNESHQ